MSRPRGVRGTILIRVFETVEELLGEKSRQILESAAGVRLEELQPGEWYPIDMYIALRRGLEDMLGPAARVVLFRVGYRASTSLASSRFGQDIRGLLDAPTGDWERIGPLIVSIIEERLGIGRASYSVGGGGLVVRIYDSLESTYGSPSGKPICHMTRGLLMFLGETFTGGAVEVVETKCRAAGDPYCEFHLKPLGATLASP